MQQIGYNQLCYPLCIIFLMSVSLKSSQCATILSSPCPNVLKYLPIEAGDEGTWTGEIQLTTEDDLQGVWIHLVLDKRAYSLLNWFGESTTLNNQEYAIRKPDYKLIGGPSVIVKIKVTYNAAEAPPVINRIRLNGRAICDKNTKPRTTEAAPLLESSNTKTTIVEREWEVTPGPKVEATSERKVIGSIWASIITSTTPRVVVALETKGTAAEGDEFYTGDSGHVGISGSSSKGKRKYIGRGGPRLVWDQDVPCGIPIKRAVPLITSGVASIEGAWPWHVAIYIQEDTYICGGSLLTRNHILTAAHCAARPKTAYPANPNGFLIHLGRTNLTGFNRGLQLRQIDTITIHPLYNHTHYKNDLAILTMSESVDYTDYVRPICMTSDLLSRDLTRELGTVVGWGYDEHNNVTEYLHETQMPVIDLLTCIYSEPEVYSKLTSTNNFCAGFKNGTSVCNGDSGGGMFFEREERNGGGMRWEIRGMVSFSVKSRNDICNPHAYAVFTDVLKYRSWIQQQVKSPNRDIP